MVRKIVIAVCVMLSASCTAIAADTPDLTSTVTALDAKLFAAYNTCDLDTLGAMVADDLEFYHDHNGLMTGKTAFVDSISKHICGKVKRGLVPGTLEVHPLKGYGAVEIGTHTFCQTDGKSNCTSPAGPARFVQLWQQTGDTWKLTRVISFDHH
jgi:ketosteroid isomerase-like protein